jgi:hypothetical protein
MYTCRSVKDSFPRKVFASLSTPAFLGTLVHEEQNNLKNTWTWTARLLHLYCFEDILAVGNLSW